MVARREILTALPLILLASLVAGPSTADAQALSEGEIAIIQPKPVLLQHRLEVVPRFGVAFADPLITQFHAGGSLYYHINERIHIGGTFEWYDFGGDFGGPTDTYNEVITVSSTVPELAPISYYGGLEVGWVPIHGKFSLFDSLIVYYDIYAIFGGGVIATVDDPMPAGTLAIGQRTFITDWLAFLVELRDRAYVEPLPSGNAFTNILTVSAGLSFFIPPAFDYAVQEETILDWD